MALKNVTVQLTIVKPASLHFELNDSSTFYNGSFYLCVFFNYQPQGKEMLSQVSVSHSVHNRPHGYTVTAHSCYGAVGTHPTGMLSCFYEVIDLPVLYLLYLFFNNCQEGEGGKLKHFVAILHLSIIRM